MSWKLHHFCADLIWPPFTSRIEEKPKKKQFRGKKKKTYLSQGGHCMNLFSVKSLSLSLVPPSQRRIILSRSKIQCSLFLKSCDRSSLAFISIYFVLLVITENRWRQWVRWVRRDRVNHFEPDLQALLQRRVELDFELNQSALQVCLFKENTYTPLRISHPSTTWMKITSQSHWQAYVSIFSFLYKYQTYSLWS